MKHMHPVDVIRIDHARESASRDEFIRQAGYQRLYEKAYMDRKLLLDYIDNQMLMAQPQVRVTGGTYDI